MKKIIVLLMACLSSGMSLANHWTPEGANYSGVMSVYSVIQINGIEQYSNQLEVGAFCGNECRGSAIANEFYLTHRYLAILTIYGETGHQLTFKLYDHSTGQEHELVSQETITFIEDGYGNPIEPYALNFTGASSGITQTINLTQGWNWFSTNVEITLDDLKATLVEAYGNTTVKIKVDGGLTTWNGHTWRGNINWDVIEMCMIEVGSAAEITLEGMPIDPAEYPITIHNGANWIGFPFTESMTLADAFNGFAVNGDKIKSMDGLSSYNGSVWRNGFPLESGHGYIYIVTTTEDRILVFPTGAK